MFSGPADLLLLFRAALGSSWSGFRGLFFYIKALTTDCAECSVFISVIAQSSDLKEQGEVDAEMLSVISAPWCACTSVIPHPPASLNVGGT